MNAEIGAILLFGLLASLVLAIGFRRGFFELKSEEWIVPLNFFQLIGAFAIYFLCTFGFSTLALFFFQNQIAKNYVFYANWLNFILAILIALFLFLYLQILPDAVRKGILCRNPKEHSLASDISNALYAWVLAFPLVLFLSQAIEQIIFKLWKISELPDQMAVRFLKSTFNDPLYFSLAVISITILAPLIEETLFRGFLQTFIRKHLGSSQAILIASASFSLFHYATGQGLGNISIIIPLFVLSLFLGFIYEKQGSLLASMILHGSFNLVSVINLYLFGGFTTGI